MSTVDGLRAEHPDSVDDRCSEHPNCHRPLRQPAMLPRLRLMRFASASARGATSSTDPGTRPRHADLADQDVDRLDLYDGTAWVTVSVASRTWTTINLASGWAQNGNSQGTFQYRIVNFAGDDTIMFRAVSPAARYPSTMPDHFTLNSTLLPASARPSTLRTIVVPCSDVAADRITLKLDITTGGQLDLYGTTATAKPPWIGFNGCSASL
jgi:hypothetical protein